MKNDIPFLDLAAQYAEVGPEIEQAVMGVLRSTHYILGPEVAAFENEFAACCQTAHAAGVNSGTSALHLALLAAGVGPGDEVVTVSMTFAATVAAILYAGATPKFVDVDPVTLTMDPAGLEAAITTRTKVILPVHLYGQPAAMDEILAIAARKNCLVIEDAAQAHGAEYKGRRVGSLGDLGCFSFYPGKNIGACGEGGAVVTSDAARDRTVRMLRDWGQREKYRHELRGFNYRMEGVQGAVLRVKLRRLEAWTEARRSRAALYDRLLADAPLVLPAAPKDVRHVYHLYVVRHPRRDALAAWLLERGIHTGLHYPVPVHLHPAYKELGYVTGDLPHTEKAAQEVLSLPMFPELSDVAVARVAEAVREFPHG